MSTEQTPFNKSILTLPNHIFIVIWFIQIVHIIYKKKILYMNNINISIILKI